MIIHKNIQTYFLFLILSLSLFSCISNETMVEAMNVAKLKRIKTDYSHVNSEQEKRITIESHNILGIDSLPSVKEIKSQIFPFLLVNYWDFQYESKIGYSNISENLQYNMKEAILEYNFKTDSLRKLNQNKLTIVIDSIKSNVPYVNKGFCVFMLLGYSMYNRDLFKPTELSITLSYKIEKNGIIKSGTFTKTENIALKKNVLLSSKHFVYDYNDDYLIELNKLLKKACNEVSDQLLNTE